MAINPVDPKWLEILKASGWQSSALAFSSGLIVLLIIKGTISTGSNPIWVAIPSIAFIIFTSLAVASILSSIAEYFEIGKNFKLWLFKRRLAKDTKAFIPFMTKQDRAIIAYLLHHNERMFQYEQDGGYAAPLISKGIIQISSVGGQIFHPYWVTFEIPDYVWPVLIENKELFPYERGQVKPSHGL